MARSIVGKIALMTLSTVVVLAALEIVLRLFGPPPPPPEENLRTYTEYDAQLGWRGRPRARGPYTTSRFSIQVALNSGGWRDDEPVIPGSSGDLRQIALLGDSFAWGYGVDRETTFGERLEASLTGWRVQSYGVCGYGTDQELLVLRQSALAIRPRIVIVEFAVGNDIDNILAARAYRLPKPRFVLEDGRLSLQGVPVPRTEDWQRAARTGARDFMTAHVRLYAWVRPRWAALKPRLGRLLRLAREDLADGGVRIRLFAREAPERVRQGWTLAEALLGAVRDEAASVGAPLVILVVPDRFQVEDDLWEQAVQELGLDRSAYHRERPNRVLAEIGQRLGVVVVDPLAVLRARASSGASLFIPDDPHWNEEGHRLAAEELRRALEPLIPPESLVGSGIARMVRDQGSPRVDAP